MLRILIADGTPAAMQAERETFGIPPNASLFEAALRAQQPDIQCSSINVADGQDLPDGVSLRDFDGLMFSGSPLHIYWVPEVTRQIDVARAAFTAGLPVWASCWGLQLATVALGGTVPPQSPWSRTRSRQSNYCHNTRPLSPAPGYAASRFRRALLSYRRARTAAAGSGGTGSERALSNSGAGGGTAVGKHLIRDAISPRVHAIGCSRVDRDAGRSSRRGGVRSRLCRVGHYGPRFPRVALGAGTPRSGLALWYRPRNPGSCPPYGRNRQLVAGSGQDFQLMTLQNRGPRSAKSVTRRR